jgi:predicted ABC-type ATPase
MSKIFVIIAGPNGSGKTTFRNNSTTLASIKFVNADNIAKEDFDIITEIESKKAQEKAQYIIEESFAHGEDICFETVFSHPSKIDLIHRAKELNYSVILIVLCPENIKDNIYRVRERVKDGGHSVPEDKIISRRPKTLKNLSIALPLVDTFQV